MENCKQRKTKTKQHAAEVLMIFLSFPGKNIDQIYYKAESPSFIRIPKRKKDNNNKASKANKTNANQTRPLPK